MSLKTLTKYDIIVVDNPALIPKHFLLLVLQPLGKMEKKKKRNHNGTKQYI